MTEFIFTSQDDSWEEALAEARERLNDAGFTFRRWFARGVGLAAVSGGFPEISRALRDNEPVFIRHICPVEHTGELGENLSENGGFSGLLPVLTDKLGGMTQAGETFSVQARVIGAIDSEQTDSQAARKGEIARRVSDYMETRGFRQDVKKPVNVVSVLTDGVYVYAGVSRADENLSAWPGGMRRFEHRAERVSRAEFKLLEAAEVFSIDLSSFRDALDLGAAPGGWSRILAEAGARVCAVDPGPLSEKLRAYQGIRHFQMTAQEFARNHASVFDLIVNDMRMDASESAGIMLEAAGMLKDGGAIVMTLKLPEKKKRAAMEKALSVMAGGYTGLRAKQLFHNRSEVTVAGKKKRKCGV